MEHPPSVLTFARTIERGQTSFAQHPTTDLAARILVGCVYEPQPPKTFGLLVTRSDPRTRRRQKHPLAIIHACWPLFAPSMQLITGHETACRARHCRRTGCLAGHVAIHLGWSDLAAAYRAELEEWPFHTRLAVARQLVAWLRRSQTVTILSFEDRPREGNLAENWAQRHVFREWACSLLPLAMPLGAARVSALYTPLHTRPAFPIPVP